MPEPRLKHVPALDGLRGAAVLAVLFFHGGHLRGGYLGVDLFFVLSGFLITSLLLAEGTERAHVGLARFWERRARRLLPALGVMLVGVAAYARFAADPTQLRSIRGDGLATIFYVANWRAVFAHLDYWGIFAAPSPLQHTWSLAIEEQFYLVWPLVFVGLVALVRRRSPDLVGTTALAKLVLALAVTLGAGSATLSLWYGFGGQTNRVYYGTDTRAFAILAGAAVAGAVSWLGPAREGWPRRVLEACGLGSMLGLGWTWALLHGESARLYQGGLITASACGAVLIAAAVQPRTGPVAKVVSLAPLRWMGLISYGVYLYHWPLFVWLTADRVHLGGWPLFGVQSAVTLAVSLLSFRFVEQPIRRGHGWPRRTNVLVPSMGFAAVSALIVASTLGYHPAPTGGFTGTALHRAVSRADASHGKRLMMIGNSVGWFLGEQGFPKVRTTPPLVTFNDAVPACTYPSTPAIRLAANGKVTSMFSASCNQRWTQSADTFKPNYVLFVRNGVSPNEYEHNGRFYPPCSEGYERWLRQALVVDAKRFTDRGATFVLVTSVYSLAGLNDLGNRTGYIQAVDCANKVMADVARAHPDTIRVIDLNRYLCTPAGVCKKSLDGVRLRPDGTHFRGRAAELIAAWLDRQLGFAATPT